MTVIFLSSNTILDAQHWKLKSMVKVITCYMLLLTLVYVMPVNDQYYIMSFPPHYAVTRVPSPYMFQ